jgi:hypothetical protein
MDITGGVIYGELSWSVVDCGFELLLAQTKDYKIVL